MAIGRLSVKVGKAGKAGPHAAYIAREGKYADRIEQGEKLEAKECGNMPEWARDNPQAFWQAADANERKNGTTYREMEIALPRELKPDQRRELVRDFVQKEIGDRHAYQWAIHTPKAADGGEQPHVHLMFSERQRDGIERDPEQYFKRYNSKNPEKGGARKEYGNVSPELTGEFRKLARKTELRDLRSRWEKTCNAHLERAGVSERIDMRSHAERQSGLLAERKQLPSEWRDPAKRAQVIEFRQARAELTAARESLRREIPNAGAEIISLQAERERRAQPDKRAEGLATMIEKLREKTKDAKPLMSGAAALEEAMQAINAKNPAQAKKEAAERAAVEAAARRATQQQQQITERENRETQRITDTPSAEQQNREKEQQRQQEQRELQQQNERMAEAKSKEADEVIQKIEQDREQKRPSVQELLAKKGFDSTQKASPIKQKTIQEQIAAQEQKRLDRMTPDAQRNELDDKSVDGPGKGRDNDEQEMEM